MFVNANVCLQSHTGLVSVTIPSSHTREESSPGRSNASVEDDTTVNKRPIPSHDLLAVPVNKKTCMH